MAFIGKPITSHLRGMISGKVEMTIDTLHNDNNYQILVIEDDHDFAKLITHWLHKPNQSVAPHLLPKNISIEHVDHLKQARHKLHTDNYDLILLDLDLPDSSGRETFEQIRTAAPTIPVVVVTTLEQEEISTEIVHLGAQDVLRKTEIDNLKLARAICYAQQRHQTSITQKSQI
ncbi:response regulator [Magnetococcales bacterium HHB-1]